MQQVVQVNHFTSTLIVKINTLASYMRKLY